jgi:hypothetical protein
MCLESDGGMTYWQGKPVPVPFCPPQIPHGLTPARTRASEVRRRRLTPWVMARPCNTITGSPFFSPPMICKFFFCYDRYTIFINAATSRIVQSVWSKMQKTSLTIGVICDSFHSSKVVYNNSRHPWDTTEAPLCAAAPTLGTTELENLTLRNYGNEWTTRVTKEMKTVHLTTSRNATELHVTGFIVALPHTNTGLVTIW